VHNLAQDLLDEGWAVDVLAPHAPQAARADSLDGVSVHRFRYVLPESQQTVCYEGGALINLRRSKSNWLKLPFLVLAELIATLSLLRRHRCAVINAHWILPQGFVGAIASCMSKTPLVVTVHGGDVFDLEGGVLRLFKRWAIRRAAAVTVNSVSTQRAVAALDPGAAIHPIPMGISVDPAPDPRQVAAVRSEHHQASGPLVVFVGRLIAEKGLDDLLEAIAEIEDATLVVLGTGQDAAQLEEQAVELGLRDRVHFKGWVQPEQVVNYLEAADVLVGPSKTSESGWKEGMGLVFLEAMAAGTPVVATRSGGIPDIVQHERTGLLVPERAPTQIAQAIRRLQTDADLRAHIIACGRQLVAESYTRQASAAAFADLFASLTDRD
jgi:glycosyltransferase involved in cell wall biosynthesis